MKFILVISATIIIAGCASTSEVSKIGKDSYMVGASARGGFTSNAEVTQMSIARANQYCSGMNKVMMLSRSTNSGVRGWTPQESEIYFKCLNEDDPEYQRSNPHKEADTVIQIQK